MAQTLAKIHQMEAISLENDQPQVEGGSAAIAMHSDPSYNFADRDAYETPYVDELQTMAMINFLLDRGEGFVSMLYTYRSCSKATPQVKTQDQENKGELYQNLFAVLEPEIAKLKDFMRFTDEAIDVFCGMVTEMSNPKRSSKTIFSENLIMSLIQMADLFVVLDALKNMKACLNNDFAFYKRAFGFLRKQSALTDSEQIENQNTYLFLAHQNRIATTLKSKLHPSPQEPGIPGFEAAIQEMLEFAATQFEEANYLLPKEKHMLLRVMPFFIYLMDGEDPNNAKTSIFRSKKVRMARYITIFQRYPIVPLYADMHITSSSFIERCKHYDDSVWGRPLPEARLEEDYNITNNLVAYRNFHQRYSAEFANMINEVRAVTDSGRQISSGQGRQIYTLVLQGFHLLSRLTSAVLEQSAWKYSRPSQNIPLDRPMEDIFEYEKVVRYNYDSEERFALIEMIGMVKSLAALVTQSSGKLAGIIRRCIHDEVQEFIQVTLRDMIRQATKKKKSTRSTLVNLRFMAADWLGGIEPKDPALTGKKDPKDGFKIQIPSRSAGPSLTQMTLIRSIVFSLFSDKSPGMKKSGLFSDKAFNNSQVQDLSAFYARSYYYSYLLDIGGTVTQLSDLSLLWYREFYLEISKQMQFPIEMSLPWILAEHILENEAPHYMEHLFFPLDLYNDAASRALSVLEQRFVFDEIEAEVNLCFDQLVYKLCELTFAQFKEAASVIQLDKTYREELEKMVPASKLAVPKNRLAVVLAQRHFQLLGRSIDLNALVAQRMNIYLRTNLDYVISKFEASPLTGVMELEASLENVRIVHSLLSEHLTLDPFDLMLADVNDGASLVSFLSRISIHVTQEIIVDLIPNYAYNSSTHRFVKPDMIFTEAFSRDPMPKIPPNYLFGSKILNAAFANVFELQKGFVGAPHFGAMYRVMGRSTLALVLADVAKYIQTKIVGTVQPYVTQLLEGMPDSSKLPQFTYGSAGVKGLLEAKLEPILGYAELKTEVFQVFREVGNSIVVHALLDRVMAVSDTQTAVLAHRFLEGEPLGQVMAAAGPAMRASAVSQAIAGGLGSAAQLAADLYAIPAEGDNVSLLRHYLLEVDAMLDPVRNEWQGPPPADGVLEIDESYEFYRLYSAMLFAFNLGERAKQFSNQDLFGDGFHWAGMTFVYAMRQQHRFNIFDFSYHCYNVEAAAAEKDPSLADFVSNARLAKEINSHILATLQAVVPQAPVDAYAFPINPPTNDEAKTMIANLPGQF